MTDLRLGVDTSQVDKGKQSLESLAEAAKKAADASDDLYARQNKAMGVQKTWADNTDKETQSIDKLLASINPLDKAFAQLEQKQKDLNAAFSSQKINSQVYHGYNEILDTQRDKLQKAQDALTAEGRAALQEAADKEKATRAQQSFIQSLERQSSAIGKSRTELLSMRAAQLGVSEKAAPMIAALESAAAAQHKFTLSSSAARRELGVMIGELGRGNFGQLRSSSITLANRSGLIDQLMTLKGLGIAAVVGGLAASLYALGKAWYEGSQESIEFNKNLILMGNYVGKTSGQLMQMADDIAHTSGVTTTAAAETINTLINSGRISGDALGNVAQAIQQENLATGESVDKLAQRYVSLTRDPVNAVKTLNDQYHFLSVSAYQRIADLQREGDLQGAATLAMNEYADTMKTRSDEIIENMGFIQRAWIDLGTAASEAWNKMLNIGKGDTLEERLAAAQQNAANASASRGLGNGQWNSYGVNYQGTDGDLDAANAEVNLLERAVALNQDLTKVKAEGAKQDAADITNLTKLNTFLQRSRENNDTKRARYNDWVADLLKRGKISPDEAQEYNNAVDYVFRDIKTTQPKTAATKTSVTQSDSRLTEAQSQLAVLKEQTDTMSIQNGQVVSINDGQKKILELEQLINSYKGQTLNAQQKSIVANAEQLKGVYQQIDAQQTLLRQRKQQLELELNLQNQAKSIDKNISYLSNTAGMSTTQKSNYQADQDLRGQFSTVYGEDWQKNTKAMQQYQSALGKLKEQQEATAASQQNLMAGISTGYLDWYEQVNNLSSIGSQAITTILNGTTSAFVDALNGSGTAFKDFAVSIIQMIEKIIMQLLIAQAIQSAMGWLGMSSGVTAAAGSAASSGVGAMGLSTSFAAYDSGGFTGDGGKYEPAGIVHKGEFVMNKEATARIGVNNLYGMMKGYATGGYVGGVSASEAGSSGSGNLNITVPVNVDGGNQNSQQNSAMTAAYQEVIKTYVRKGIQEETKPGGIIYKATKR